MKYNIVKEEGYIKWYNNRFAIWFTNQYICPHHRYWIDLIQIGYLEDYNKSKSIYLTLFGFQIAMTLYETFSEGN